MQIGPPSKHVSQGLGGSEYIASVCDIEMLVDLLVGSSQGWHINSQYCNLRVVSVWLDVAFRLIGGLACVSCCCVGHAHRMGLTDAGISNHAVLRHCALGSCVDITSGWVGVLRGRQAHIHLHLTICSLRKGISTQKACSLDEHEIEAMK